MTADGARQTLRQGGCQCGAVRYEVSCDTLKLVICHCRECRKQSASAFGVSVFVPRESLRVTSGSPKFWSRATDSGHALECAFCADCGSRLWHQPSGAPDIVSIKGGSLDDPPDLSSAVHIWTSRMLPGIVLPHGAEMFPYQPD
jgi:hypothetical protein